MCSPKISASVMSVMGSKALEVGEGHTCVGILASRVCLRGQVGFAIEALPWYWKDHVQPCARGV